MIGLMHGHFDSEAGTVDSVALDSANRTKLNTGIGIVVPVRKITECLDQPSLLEAEQKALRDLKR